MLTSISAALAVVHDRQTHRGDSAHDVISASLTQSALEQAKVTAAPTPPATPTPSPSPKPKAVAKPKAVKPDPWARYGYDISWPQCGQGGPVLPPLRGSTAIVGITGGRPMTSNPCLAAQWKWASAREHSSAYINLAFPYVFGDPAAYGARTARLALARARSAGMKLTGVWLDIESGNHWSVSHLANNAVIRGAINQIKAEGLQPGIYTTQGDWSRITGNARMTVPLWQAVFYPHKQVATCSGKGIGGRTPDLVQAVIEAKGTTFDQNYICTKRADFLKALG